MIKSFMKRLITSTGSLLAQGALDAYSAHTSGYSKFVDASPYASCRTSFGHMLVRKSDMFIGSGFMHCGDFRTDRITKALTIMSELGIDLQTRCFLDIGANIGSHGICALRTGFERAIFIEPDPENFRLLRINQILNNVDSQCLNFEIAASDADGPLTLERSEYNFGDHRIRVNVSENNRGVYEEECRACLQVHGRSIDSLASSKEIDLEDVDLVWVDTQGHEGNVLAGAETLVEHNVPMVLEFWPYGLERVRGYGLLRGAISHYHRILDLEASAQAEELVTLTVTELDTLYHTLLQAERPPDAAQTDLLVF